MRFKYLKTNINMRCTTFIDDDIITSNLEKISKMTMVNSSQQINKNFKKSNINNAAEMFLFLNSCPSFYEKLYFKAIYGPKSRIAMLTSNIIKKANTDLKKIAIQIFVKMSSMLGFKHISYQHEDNRGGRNLFTKSIGVIKGETLQVVWTLIHFSPF